MNHMEEEPTKQMQGDTEIFIVSGLSGPIDLDIWTPSRELNRMLDGCILLVGTMVTVGPQ